MLLNIKKRYLQHADCKFACPDEIKTEINESVWISVFVDLLGCAKCEKLLAQTKCVFS